MNNVFLQSDLVSDPGSFCGYTRENQQRQRGFTLIEMLVAISVAIVFLSGMLISQGDFDSTVRLSSITRDTALLVRQAQTYGAGGGSDIEIGQPHGVYLSENNPNEIVLYSEEGDSDGYQQNDDQVIETLDLPGPYTIKDFCFDISNTIDSANGCAEANSPSDLSIFFVRPSLEANFYSDDDSGADSARQAAIELSHESSGQTKMIKVDVTGYISTP